MKTHRERDGLDDYSIGYYDAVEEGMHQLASLVTFEELLDILQVVRDRALRHDKNNRKR